MLWGGRGGQAAGPMQGTEEEGVGAREGSGNKRKRGGMFAGMAKAWRECYEEARSWARARPAAVPAGERVCVCGVCVCGVCVFLSAMRRRGAGRAHALLLCLQVKSVCLIVL